MTSIITVDTEDFFQDTNGIVGGIARMNVDGEFCYDADIGGQDGWYGSAELIDVRIGALVLTRYQLVEAFSEAMVADFEDRQRSAWMQSEGMAA